MSIRIKKVPKEIIDKCLEDTKATYADFGRQTETSIITTQNVILKFINDK